MVASLRIALGLVLLSACAGPTVGGEASGSDAGDGASGAAGTAGQAGQAGQDAGSDAGNAEPRVLAAGRDCPSDLRVKNGVIVWVDQGSLQNGAQDGVLATMPASGCDGDAASCVTVLATDQHSPSAVELDPLTNTIYWATFADDTIWSLTSGSTNPIAFASAQNAPRGLGIDQTALYWSNSGGLGQGDGEIRRSWLDGGSPGGAAIVGSLELPNSLVVVDTWVYWTNYGVNETDGRVMGSDITGAGAGDIVTNQSDPRGITASPSHIYWANGFDGTIWRARRDGSEPMQIISGRYTPSDVAVDSNGIYWVDAGTPEVYADGKVMAARLDGSEITTIASDQLDPRRIEIDGDTVYWLNRGTQGVAKCSQHDGAVMSAPKPW